MSEISEVTVDKIISAELTGSNGIHDAVVHKIHAGSVATVNESTTDSIERAAQGSQNVKAAFDEGKLTDSQATFYDQMFRENATNANEAQKDLNKWLSKKRKRS